MPEVVRVGGDVTAWPSELCREHRAGSESRFRSPQLLDASGALTLSRTVFCCVCDLFAHTHIGLSL